MMQQLLGQVLLNITFVLYLILYLPQILHNAKYKKYHFMSEIMHYSILLGYACDLCYGLMKHLPWQYITVSCIGLGFLLIQHLQWFNFKQKNQINNRRLFLYFGFLLLLLPIFLFLYMPQNSLKINSYGWISRIAFILHFLPQIIKNNQAQNEPIAINMAYLNLSISLNLIDLGAATLLHWGNINLIGGCLSLILKIILLLQIYAPSKSKLFFLKTRSAR